jgi:hypothetical protein
MRPYIAVIKDSFREALASRVLWVLLVLITGLLLLLTPFSFQQKAASTLQPADVFNGDELLATLRAQENADRPVPARRIWELLSPELQTSIRSADPADSQRDTWNIVNSLRAEFNRLLQRRDLYDETAWKGIHLQTEAEELKERGIGNLSDDEAARFNRLLLERTFPANIAVSPRQQVDLTYLGLTLGDGLPLEPHDVRKIIREMLVLFAGFFAGNIGVFVAILVTAAIMPRTFEPGAIDLLLSKPISRSLLFLAKFAGGCAFILLNASYLIVGLWLIAGWRHGVWHSQLLLCIPIYLFLFAIYYSVSSLAGAVWRGPVMAVVITIVFWLACTTVGAVKGFAETLYLSKSRLAVVVPTGKSLLAANRGGDVFEWDAERNEWNPVFESRARNPMPFVVMSPLIGPVYDAQSDRIFALEAQGAQFGMPGSSGKLLMGRRDDGWQRRSTVDAPGGMTDLFIRPGGELIVAGPMGLYQFEGDPSIEHKPFRLFGFDLAPKTEAGRFVSIRPAGEALWGTPFSIAMNPADGAFAVFERGNVLRLDRTPDANPDGNDPTEPAKYVVGRRRNLETTEPGRLAFAGDTIVAALGNGTVLVLDADTLEPQNEFTPFPNQKPRDVVAADDGRWFAVVYHHRRLWLYNAVSGHAVQAQIDGHKDIQAVAFSEAGGLLAADRFRRVTEYGLDAFPVRQRYQPEPTWVEWAYRYAIVPIYTVFPKPGELDNLVMYLITDQRSQALGGDDANLEAERVVLDLWQPIWSNLAFLSVVLGLTCVYVVRRDF